MPVTRLACSLFSTIAGYVHSPGPCHRDLSRSWRFRAPLQHGLLSEAELRIRGDNACRDGAWMHPARDPCLYGDPKDHRTCTQTCYKCNNSAWRWFFSRSFLASVEFETLSMQTAPFAFVYTTLTRSPSVVPLRLLFVSSSFWNHGYGWLFHDFPILSWSRIPCGSLEMCNHTKERTSHCGQASHFPVLMEREIRVKIIHFRAH